ncbi:MAG TPA: flagellar basal body-associated protein FliL [Microvirga sp.]|jgi:flagellar FliL protein
MAKKPKTEAAPEEAADGAPAAAAAPKKSRKKLIVGALAAVLLLGGGGGVYAYLQRSAPAVEPEAVRKPVAFIDIREMTVNLASEPGQDRQRFLKFRVSLEVKDQKTIGDIQPLLPRVEDAFQVFVRELRANDLDGSSGVYRLREELLRRVNIAVYPAKVEAVLFKDIVVQ